MTPFVKFTFPVWTCRFSSLVVVGFEVAEGGVEAVTVLFLDSMARKRAGRDCRVGSHDYRREGMKFAKPRDRRTETLKRESRTLVYHAREKDISFHYKNKIKF